MRAHSAHAELLSFHGVLFFLLHEKAYRNHFIEVSTSIIIVSPNEYTDSSTPINSVK
jgi:hypothetical protein